ncbi:MAG: sugar ABC transporter ATP-binding protein [Actinomycetia bacterium]|nr:sugar ABC transporter ATP-binding protein [Actinomycetes bacterium]
MSRVEPLLTLNDVSKRFGATRALEEVTVAFRAGEVHALVGENGAGKSTLGKIVLGVHTPDDGQLTLDGTQRQLSGPADAAGHGLVGVAQELSLLPAMTVVDNIVLGSEEHRGPLVNQRANRKRVEALIVEHGLEVPLDARVGSLSVADQQKVEILRALGRKARLVVFDEPTARLASHEAHELRQTVRDLAANGTAVVYISHFLEEVLSVADTITVMRDGQIVSTRPAEEETHDSLVEAMTGRSLDDAFPPKAPPPPESASIVLQVSGLTIPGEFDDVSFHIREGEIVGLAGLVGAGRSEVAHAIYGASRPTAGVVKIAGVKLGGTIRHALASSISLIPESRRDQGLVAGRSVEENTTLPHLARFSGWMGIQRDRERVAAEKACQDAGVRTESMGAAVSSLSGGNQQKVLFARAMLGETKLFIADEPTRGVDVGAKRAIYDVLTNLAVAGSAVLLISSELEEVIGLSNRVLVMHQGRLVAEYEGENMTESSILNAAFGSDSEAKSHPASSQEQS